MKYYFFVCFQKEIEETKTENGKKKTTTIGFIQQLWLRALEPNSRNKFK